MTVNSISRKVAAIFLFCSNELATNLFSEGIGKSNCHIEFELKLLGLNDQFNPIMYGRYNNIFVSINYLFKFIKYTGGSAIYWGMLLTYFHCSLLIQNGPGQRPFYYLEFSNFCKMGTLVTSGYPISRNGQDLIILSRKFVIVVTDTLIFLWFFFFQSFFIEFLIYQGSSS